MQRQPMSLQQFQRAFVTEQACMDHLFGQRWPNGYVCPRCNNSKCSFHSSRRLYQCSRCKYQCSLTAGTIFHKTKTPLTVWFWMIFLMTRPKSGVSMMSLQRMLGIRHYKTAWMMGHKIRKAMADREARRGLAGLVDIGEGTVGAVGEESDAGEANSSGSVIASVEKRKAGLGYAILRLERNPENQSSEVFISGSSHPSPTVFRRREKPSDQSPPAAAPRGAQILISNLRGIIKGVHHGVSAKHLHRYLGEFSYRFNHRWREAELFDLALLACVGSATITFAELNL